MRNLIVVTVVLVVGCGTSGTDTKTDADANSPSDGNPNSDGNTTDGPAVSHAPCDSCCDPIAQDCGTSQACHPNDNGNITTCKTAGIGQLGAGCGVDTDCLPGTTCLGDDFGDFFRCYKLCLIDAECGDFPSQQHKCTLYTVPTGRTPYGLCFP